jgi:hypothetical protein
MVSRRCKTRVWSFLVVSFASLTGYSSLRVSHIGARLSASLPRRKRCLPFDVEAQLMDEWNRRKGRSADDRIARIGLSRAPRLRHRSRPIGFPRVLSFTSQRKIKAAGAARSVVRTISFVSQRKQTIRRCLPRHRVLSRRPEPFALRPCTRFVKVGRRRGSCRDFLPIRRARASRPGPLSFLNHERRRTERRIFNHRNRGTPKCE